MFAEKRVPDRHTFSKTTLQTPNDKENEAAGSSWLCALPCAADQNVQKAPMSTPYNIRIQQEVCVVLNNVIHSLGDHIARQAKEQQTSGNPEEPRKVSFVFLAWHPYVHTPKTRDDVHGEHNRTENSELAENICRLFLTLIHPYVDLCEVVTVRSSQYSVHVSKM